MSNPSQWKYVSTKHNLADLASRGTELESFLKNEMWLSGPPFLLQPREACPADPDDLGEPLPENPEVKVSAILSVEQERDDAVTCLINRSSD